MSEVDSSRNTRAPLGVRAPGRRVHGDRSSWLPGLIAPVTVAGPRRTRTGFLRGVAARGLSPFRPADAGVKAAPSRCDARRPERCGLVVGRRRPVVSGPCPPLARQSDADACPGALRLHAAADGPLARVRLPGGLLTGAQLRGAARARRAVGRRRTGADLPGQPPAPRPDRRPGRGAGRAACAAAGLLPSDTHERVRNIAAAAAAGRRRPAAAGHARWTRRCAPIPALAELPGRFLFAVDDGAGDVAAADVAAAVGVLLGGRTPVLLAGDATPAVVAAAHAVVAGAAARRRTRSSPSATAQRSRPGRRRARRLPAAGSARPIGPARSARPRPARSALRPGRPAVRLRPRRSRRRRHREPIGLVAAAGRAGRGRRAGAAGPARRRSAEGPGRGRAAGRDAVARGRGARSGAAGGAVVAATRWPRPGWRSTPDSPLGRGDRVRRAGRAARSRWPTCAPTPTAATRFGRRAAGALGRLRARAAAARPARTCGWRRPARAIGSRRRAVRRGAAGDGRGGRAGRRGEEGLDGVRARRRGDLPAVVRDDPRRGRPGRAARPTSPGWRSG